MTILLYYVQWPVVGSTDGVLNVPVTPALVRSFFCSLKWYWRRNSFVPLGMIFQCWEETGFNSPYWCWNSIFNNLAWGVIFIWQSYLNMLFSSISFEIIKWLLPLQWNSIPWHWDYIGIWTNVTHRIPWSSDTPIAFKPYRLTTLSHVIHKELWLDSHL